MNPIRWCVALLALAAVARAFVVPIDAEWETRWVQSSDPKYAGNSVELAKLFDSQTDALKIPTRARHYGLTTKLPEPVDPSKGLVLQFETKLPPGGLTCGGAYLKFLTAEPGFEAADLTSDTPYTVMFGPDKCGANSKTHLIIRHRSPKTGEVEEKHLVSPPPFVNDNFTHVFTAELYPQNSSYRVLIDGAELKDGSLFEDFEPPFNPPETIPDPEDVKPSDWVDEATIPDPEATKPDDWDEDAPAEIDDPEAAKPEGWLDDEPLEVDDPEATEPEDWDEDEDGEWEPPRVPNPACAAAPGCGPWSPPKVPNPEYKGKWTAPLVPNPAYKGPWAPRQVPNPAHVRDDEPLAHVGEVGAVAIEIWTMDQDYYFGEVVVANDPAEAERARRGSWRPIHEAETAAEDARAAEHAERLAEDEQKRERAERAKELRDDPSRASVDDVAVRLFDSALLAPYAATLEPLRALAESNPRPFLGGLLATLFVVVYLGLGALAALLPAKKMARQAADQAPAAALAKKDDQARAAALAKKDDETAPNDDEEEEDKEEEEEEEEEKKKKEGIRRRTRRD